MPFSAIELRKSGAGAALVDHVVALAGGAPAAASDGRSEVARGPEDEGRRALAGRGFFALGAVVRPDCERLRAVVDALVADGLPGVLVYLLDDAWVLGEAVRAATSALLGTDYVLAADAWAWSLPPGRARGWSPHRGVADVLLDRDRPEIINVWIALSDASLDRACMSFVPLDDDPAYPGALASTRVPDAAAIPLPVAAGTVLAWNANVLHWGGECRASAAGPRTSCSFTLVRRDAVDRMGFATVEPSELDVARRLDVVAAQIVTYGEGQPDVDSVVLSWARATVAFAGVARKDR